MLTATFEADLAGQPGRRSSSEQASHFHLQLTLQAEAGRTTVLLGESGAGKSTVLRLLAGLLRPARGQMILDGVCYFDGERDIFVPPQERPIGYVFQDYLLFPHLTV
ncbi:MAG: ATP-binding cassette domain-containing protein, partial [Thermogemmatispora sp.]